MVRRNWFTTATALCAVLVVSGGAAAQGEGDPDAWINNVCGFGSATGLKVCASADFFLNGDQLEMRVWNMEVAGGGSIGDESAYDDEFGGWHTIFAVGLEHMRGAYTASATSLSADYVTETGIHALSNWVLGANSLQAELGSNTQKGHQEGVVGCTDPGPTNANHVQTCAMYGFKPYLRLTFGGVDLGGRDIEEFNFLFHSAQIGSDLEDSAKGGGQIVPEPITLVLLGSGLAGVGAAARRRRREGLGGELD